jgi:hypothetical protein
MQGSARIEASRPRRFGDAPGFGEGFADAVGRFRRMGQARRRANGAGSL